MSEGFVASDVLEKIEEAIRYKLGTQDDYSPPEMPGAIMDIPQEIDGRVGRKDITKNGEYNAIDDYLDGYDHVNVRVPTEESGGKILPVLINLDATENGTYDASDEDADGYDVVNINVPPIPAKLTEVRIEENGVIDPPDGFDGFSRLRVSVLSDANIDEKPDEININGVYEAIDDGLDGYSKVKVNMHIQNEKEFTENGEFFPDGTNAGVYKMNVNVNPPLEEGYFTSNGEYNPTGTNYGFSKVNVNVPNPPLESGYFTSNGEYNPTGTNYGFSKVNVNVPDPPLESGYFTSNGDYYPSGSNYGFSHVNVRVPEKIIGERSVITANGEYFASTNSFDGFSKVNVQVPSSPQPNIQASKSVTLSDSATINPDSGYDAMARVVATVTHPPLQDSKSLSVSYGTTTINPDGTNVAMKKVIVTTPPQPTFGTKTFTSNGVYNANSYGFNGFNQVNIQVPTGPSINLNNVLYYYDGTKNAIIEQNRACVGGYPTFGFDYSGVGMYVHIGNSIVDASHMFEGTNINAHLDRRSETGALCFGDFLDYSYMFNGCSSFNMGLPFTEINNAMNLEMAFCGCEKYDYGGIYIRSTYPGYTNVSAESMFKDCKNLYLAEIGINMSISGLYNTSNMFKNCKLYSKNINFPACIKESKFMFDNCTSFNANIIFNTSASYKNLCNMQGFFNNCVSFNSNLINVTNLGASNFYRMFYNCVIFDKPIPNLYYTPTGVYDFPKWSTSRMFENCYRFNQKVNIYTGGIFVNSENMFMNCTNMDSVVNIYVKQSARFRLTSMFRGCNNFKSNVYILKCDGADIYQNDSSLYSEQIYNRNILTTTQPYRMNILCASTNIYNAFLRDMYMPPTWTQFSDGVYNTKYNVYVYNHL